jgi:hypothetical protein
MARRKERSQFFDSCDEVRRKMKLYLSKTGMSKAAFGREICKLMGGEEKKKISGGSITQFLGKKGPMAGNTAGVYYGAYVFFEKIRVRDGKPMTEHRETMEDVGMDVTCGFGERKALMGVK